MSYRLSASAIRILWQQWQFIYSGFIEAWVEGWVGERALEGVSIGVDEDVAGEGVEDGIMVLMAEINPKMANRYFIWFVNCL